MFLKASVAALAVGMTQAVNLHSFNTVGKIGVSNVASAADIAETENVNSVEDYSPEGLGTGTHSVEHAVGEEFRICYT